MGLLISRIIYTLIVVMIVFFVLQKIWTKNVDIISPFKKLAEYIPEKEMAFKEPIVKCSLRVLPTNYAQGLEVEGVKWQNDFREYYLLIKNESVTSELYDLRITLHMHGGIVNYKIVEKSGCEDLDVNKNYITGGIGPKKKDIITKTTKQFTNILKIQAVKLFPSSIIGIKIFVKVLPSTIENGTFSISYRYFVSKEEKKEISMAYNIVIDDKDKQTVHIDTSNPLDKNYKRSFIIVPETPLIFKKNGSIMQKDKNSP